MSEDFLKVQPIRNGTVIDHIEAGCGRKVLDILELENSGTTISLLINVQSKKQKRKDIIKIEDRELDENEIEKLALLSPNARVNIIRNYAVADKKKVDIPNLISNIVECPNGNCISNNERGAISKFKLIDSSMLIKCTYCGRKIKEESINFL
ncbi:MAG: aspartate carbamoyltransferase regulatory subunit [Euryarchaeota archaeon]|nr:aspartate carbamoyltransferase regulatory subunit [Euryarchaeota archaeon]